MSRLSEIFLIENFDDPRTKAAVEWFVSQSVAGILNVRTKGKTIGQVDQEYEALMRKMIERFLMRMKDPEIR